MPDTEQPTRDRATDDRADDQGERPRVVVVRDGVDRSRARTGLIALRDRLSRLPRGLVALLVVLALGAGGAFWWTQRGLPSDVAVRVGGTDVSTGQLRERMATVKALYGVTEPSAAAERRRYWRDAAQSTAVGIVLRDAARERDVRVSAAEVDEMLNQIVTTYYGEGSAGQQAFVKALTAAGTSETQVRAEVRRQLEVTALFRTVAAPAKQPGDSAVDAAYTERRCRLAVPETRRLRNIVVLTEDDARRVLERLRAGTPFAALAKSVSIDASTKDAGGEIGDVRADQLEKDYAAAAFTARSGGLFGPVRSSYGWNVGQVEAVTASRVPPLAEIRDQLRATLTTEAQSALWRRWLRERLEAAEVQYAAAYRPRNPTALPAAGDPATAGPAGDPTAPASTAAGAATAGC